MPIFLPNIADLMHFSLEELVRKFNVSPKELRNLADKIEQGEPNDPDDEKEKEKKIIKEYYNKIINSKRRKP